MVLPNPDLKAEKVFTAEIGYRAQWLSRLWTDVTAFSSHYEDLIQLGRGEPALQRGVPLHINQPLVWRNSAQEVTRRGVEVVIDWHALDWMSFTGSYTHLKIEQNLAPYNVDTAGISPRHRGALRWQLDVTEQIQFDTTLRYVGKLTAANQNVPAYTTFDARLAYRPIKGMEWSIIAQNLFSPNHVEFSDSPTTSLIDSTVTVPRSIYGKLSWSF